jgi:hypothetical protein
MNLGVAVLLFTLTASVAGPLLLLRLLGLRLLRVE